MAPIYRGTTPVQKCYRGTVAISAIYRGTSLVFSTAAAGPVATTIPVYPSVRSAASVTHSSSTGTVTAETVNRPDGVQQGDLLVLYSVMDYGALSDLTVPTGFTQLGELSAGTSNVAHSVAYKVATASEPTTYT